MIQWVLDELLPFFAILSKLADQIIIALVVFGSSNTNGATDELDVFFFWWTQINAVALDCVIEGLVAALENLPRRHLHHTMDELTPLLLAKHPAIQLGAYGLILKSVNLHEFHSVVD